MTDEQLEKTYNEMKKMFPNLPNFEHFPKTFAYYARLYRIKTR